MAPSRATHQRHASSATTSAKARFLIETVGIPTWLIGLFVFAFGSCIGSFLNVCVYRMPREESLVRPRSRCPKCQRPIRWHENIPILSYLALGAKCRGCRNPISWRYPLVEAITGVAALAVVHRTGFTWPSLVYFVFLCGLITSSFIDLEFQIIPDEISLGGLALGVVASALVPALHDTNSYGVALTRSLIGALAGGGTIYATGLLGDFLFKKESMGGGDVKLMAMAGSILGWKAVVLAFFLAPMLALLPGLYVLFVKKSHVIPYGPFLSLGLVVSLFYGSEFLRVTGLEESFQFMWDYYGWR